MSDNLEKALGAVAEIPMPPQYIGCDGPAGSFKYIREDVVRGFINDCEGDLDFALFKLENFLKGNDNG